MMLFHYWLKYAAIGYFAAWLPFLLLMLKRHVSLIAWVVNIVARHADASTQHILAIEETWLVMFRRYAANI